MKKAKKSPQSPKAAPKAINIRPHPGPQTLFLSTSADIAIYGGGAGAGKTFALLMEILRHINTPTFKALIVRQTYAQIKKPGAIWDDSTKIYPRFGAKPSGLKWVFPSGATVDFGYLDLDKDKNNYDGAQVPLICFDQLEQIKGDNFFYMLSRNRSDCGVRPYIRATCNPKPRSWLSKFISWWIDPNTGYAIPERSGVLRWFVRLNNEIIWGDSRQELVDRFKDKFDDEIRPLSVTFIPATLRDNPSLMKANPDYLSNLLALDAVEKERLLDGNWLIEHTSGKVFKRHWFNLVKAVPSPAQFVSLARHWDRAATAFGGDWTVGLLMGRTRDDEYYIIDIVRGQWGVAEVREALKKTAALDAMKYGRKVEIGLEQEPGSAGVDTIYQTVKDLAGYATYVERPTGSKIERAKPLSAQAAVRNVFVLEAEWTEVYLDEMEDFPPKSKRTGDKEDNLGNDDQVDASSGAFNRLAGPVAPKQIIKSHVYNPPNLFG